MIIFSPSFSQRMHHAIPISREEIVRMHAIDDAAAPDAGEHGDFDDPVAGKRVSPTNHRVTRARASRQQTQVKGSAEHVKPCRRRTQSHLLSQIQGSKRRRIK